MKTERERLDPYQRALRNPKSLMLAIRAKCWDCEGRGGDPGWQGRIGTCVVKDCPLWHVRPYQESASRRGNDNPVARIAREAFSGGSHPDPVPTMPPNRDRSEEGRLSTSHEQGMESGVAVETSAGGVR